MIDKEVYQFIVNMKASKAETFHIDHTSLSIIKNNSGYYNYLILDPRKKEVRYIQSLGITINHECFYVGKGSGMRIISHFSLAQLCRKIGRYNKIRRLLLQGYKPIVILANYNLTEDTANEKEIETIKEIGRKDKNQGSLLNLTDGGKGAPANVKSLKTKEAISQALIRLNRKGEQNHKSIRVYQYDLGGNYINSYESIADAKRNIPGTEAIVHCFRGKKFKSAGGYMWFREYKGEKTEPLKLHPWRVEKKVYQYRKSDDSLVKVYNTIKEASEETGLTRKAISYSFLLPDKKKGIDYYWRR